MEERTYEELLKENESFLKERREWLKDELLLVLGMNPHQKKLCRRLIDWEAVYQEKDCTDVFFSQIEAVKADFPELFEETRPAESLPRFVPMGRSRRKGFSEKARSVMGLK